MRPDHTIRPLPARSALPARLPAARPADGPTREARAAADVEVSVRVDADGTQIAVVRRTVAEGGGRRTVGIDAVIR